jgi:hypothetical protein
MDRLSRDINSLENSVARYIYIKYIQDCAQEPIIENKSSKDDKTANIDHDASSQSNDSESEDEQEEVIAKTKVIRPKIIDKELYAIYQKRIFHHSRSCFVINQDDLIREDIQIMTLADKAYEENPETFKVKNFDLLPDVLRCSFIRKHHHRYYRCRNIIMNKDSDVCTKHEKRENIYYDNYNELLEKLDI